MKNSSNVEDLATIARVVLKIIKLVILIIKEEIMIIGKWNTAINEKTTVNKEQLKEETGTLMNIWVAVKEPIKTSEIIITVIKLLEI